MKIIGSGFGRTGTLSMKKALEELGFGPCYHMQEAVARPKHVKLWHEIATGNPGKWSAIFKNFESTVDFPASVYYKEIFEQYPDAKVIHTVREPERWYNSTKETIYTAGTIFPKWLLRWVKPFRIVIEMQDLIIWQRLFNGRFEDKSYALQVFEDWTEEVKRVVPEDQLLVFSVKEGWGPLCQFLNVPVPNTPFPRVNDRKSMQRQLRLAHFAMRLGPLVLALLVFVSLYFLLQ